MLPFWPRQGVGVLHWSRGQGQTGREWLRATNMP